MFVYLIFTILLDERIFLLHAIVPNSKKYQGFRSEVFRLLGNHLGNYFTSREHSIQYDNNNLNLHVLFAEKNDARLFISSLIDSGNSFSIKHISHNIESIKKPECYQEIPIYATDYHRDEGDTNPSPDYSVSSWSTIMKRDPMNPVTRMKMVEKDDLREFVASGVYGALIAGKKQYKRYSKDEDNFINCSWTFHDWFDGLNSKRAVGGIAHFPSILISYHSHENSDVPVGNGTFLSTTAVFLLINCRSKKVFEAVGSVLKPGSRLSDDQKGWITSINVFNLTLFKEVLMLKYNSTLSKWTKARQRCNFYFDGGAEEEEEMEEFANLDDDSDDSDNA